MSITRTLYIAPISTTEEIVVAAQLLLFICALLHPRLWPGIETPLRLLATHFVHASTAYITPEFELRPNTSNIRPFLAC